MKKYHPIKGKVVHIIFQSKGLGDTLAWFPYVEEFRKKYNCKVKLFLPRQEMIPLLKDNYSHIEFLLEDDYMAFYDNFNKDLCFKLPFHDGIITYKIGFSWDGRQYIPLQKTATETLGLEFIERKPNLVFKNYGRPIKKKYVCIGVHSNGPQLKYWNYPNGWDYVVKYLKHKGYKVLDIDLNEDQSSDGFINKMPDGVIKSSGKSLKTRINQLIHSEFFIGLGSGLSWLAWSLNKRVIMISGMSLPWHEFQHNCIHVHNFNVCHGCYNRDETLNLKGDWNICPDHKGTNRMFECSKKIDPPMVFDAIDRTIELLK